MKTLADMKYITCLLLFIGIINSTHAQLNNQFRYGSHQSSLEISKKPFPELLQQTNRIMTLLGIKKRLNIQKDGVLLIRSNDKEIGLNCYFFKGDFNTLRDYDRDTANDMPMIYYTKPYIFMAQLLDDIVTKKRDTTKVTYERALSYLVHELTHYLQIPPYERAFEMDSMDDEQYRKYTLQRPEFEAFSVCSYFFMENYNEKELKRIMKLNQPIHRKMEILIDAYRKVIYPNRNALFP